MSDNFKKITLSDDAGNESIILNGSTGNLALGGGGHGGDISMRDEAGKNIMHIDGNDANISAGGYGHAGEVFLKDGEGKTTVHINGGSANLILGGNGQDGDIAVKNEAGQYAILLDGHSGDIRIMGRYIDPADFVFDTEYPLPALDTVSQFITNNKHLPGIPSGNQMKNQGLSMTNFTMKLLQKVEELTLYVIQQNERIKELEQKMA